METEPQALWTQILKAKYCKGRDLDSIVARRYSCSNAWKGILETLEWTQRGVGVTVGDGRQTKFWSHRWLDGIILQEKALSAVPEAQLNKRVCDYWQGDMGWDWSQLSPYLPSDTLQRIASFELIMAGVGDKKVWIANKMGKFSIRSAMKLMGTGETQDPANWR